MKRLFTLLVSIGILNLFLFLGIFKLFQNDKIYHNTIGVVSQNYERVGGWDNYKIKKVSKPYLQFKNENFLRWDASIYKCISERMYVNEKICYGNVRGAFFPLFSILWRITKSSPIGISVINYLMYILSISLLVIYLLQGNTFKKILIFSVLISLPSTIIYYIPYTEALFLLTMTIAVIGIMKEKYWMYFIGILLMSMVRPATVFVLLAILSVEILILIKNKKFSLFINNSFLRIIPFVLGYFCSFLIQYLYSGSWTSFVSSQKHWDGGIQKISNISDWSIEGFGMNSFAVFFVAIPASLFLVFLIANFKNDKLVFLTKIENYKTDYLFLISVFYLAGIFVFILITSGGNLRSFFRFTLTSPLFYVTILILIDYLSKIKFKKFVLGFIILTFLLFLFLRYVEYGGDRMQFSFFGLYMLLLSFFYLMIRNILPRIYDIIAFIVLVIANTIWNTYLLNAFFSNGWLFT